MHARAHTESTNNYYNKSQPSIRINLRVEHNLGRSFSSRCLGCPLVLDRRDRHSLLDHTSHTLVGREQSPA